MTRWMVTGAAGYIGAHVVRALTGAGHDVLALDDLSTGVRGRVPDGVPFLEHGIGTAGVARAVSDRRIEGVVHLAAKKSVPESVADPLRYYDENVAATSRLLRAAVDGGARAVLYSSSAAVYGETGAEPVTEDHPTAPTSPYGETKLAAEWAVRSAAAAHDLHWCALRYFNVAGAADALLADRGASNLLPLVQRAVATGEPVTVFGDDWPTPDGTCVRDYVHVEDLADAHVAAVAALDAALAGRGGSPGALNVGRSAGVSVLEMIDAVARIAGRPVPHRVGPRRPGDPARVVADCTRIGERLGWRASRGVDAMAGAPRPEADR